MVKFRFVSCYNEAASLQTDVSREVAWKGRSTLVFKAQLYTQQTKRLGLRRRIETLLSDLRGNIGDDFLQNARILIAHPVQANRNIFQRTYALNFLANSSHVR